MSLRTCLQRVFARLVKCVLDVQKKILAQTLLKNRSQERTPLCCWGTRRALQGDALQYNSNNNNNYCYHLHVDRKLQSVLKRVLLQRIVSRIVCTFFSHRPLKQTTTRRCLRRLSPEECCICHFVSYPLEFLPLWPLGLLLLFLDCLNRLK